MRSMPATLIAPGELAPHLNDANWAIIDCRFDLARPDWGAQAYAAGHIPHALYAHLDHDLSAARTPRSGRHPLPQVEALAITFGRLGIDEHVQVIAYDQGTGAYAARLWWLLRWLGHRRVAVLDGGFAAWQRAGLPISTGVSARAARTFRAVADAGMVASTAEVAAALDSGALARQELLLVDARSADRFAGENETIDPVAGHIPGAVSAPTAQNVAADGTFRSPAQLAGRFAALGAASVSPVGAYCGSGVTAAHEVLALTLAGIPAALYAGSWSDWVTDPSRPVASGPGAG